MIVLWLFLSACRGEIILKKQIDRELDDRFMFDITASDGYFYSVPAITVTMQVKLSLNLWKCVRAHYIMVVTLMLLKVRMTRQFFFGRSESAFNVDKPNLSQIDSHKKDDSMKWPWLFNCEDIWELKDHVMNFIKSSLNWITVDMKC